MVEGRAKDDRTMSGEVGGLSSSSGRVEAATINNELRRSKLRGIEIARASRTSVIVAHAIACILLPDLVVAHTVGSSPHCLVDLPCQHSTHPSRIHRPTTAS